MNNTLIRKHVGGRILPVVPMAAKFVSDALIQHDYIDAYLLFKRISKIVEK
jgi:hypothetical protein